MSILNEITNSVTQEATRKAKMVYLDPHRCIPNPLNSKRKMNDIDELSFNILDGGLQQPIVVREIDGSQDYMIITGHRRNLAVLKIVDDGNSYYFNGRLCEDEIPAFIVSTSDEIDERLKVLQSNAYLDETKEDKIIRAKETAELYDLLVAEGKKPKGLKRAWIASITGYSERAVQDYLKIPLENEENENDDLSASDAPKKEVSYFDKISKKIEKFEAAIEKINIEELTNDEAEMIAKRISDLYDVFHSL